MQANIIKGLTLSILAAGAALLFVPLVWMLSTSLKDPSQVFVYPPQWIPDPVVWENYYYALALIKFPMLLKNTCIITFLSILGTVGSSSLVAYGFARLRFRGRDLLFFVVLATMMLPWEVTMIPRYILFRMLGWLDSFKPLIIPHFFGGGAFNIFLLRQFYMTIPYELDDAAHIDGAGRLTIYWRILVPLCRPALATVAVFGFMNNWNDFMGPLIYINSLDKLTLSLGINLYRSVVGTRYNYLMAGSLVIMLAPLLLFFVAQRYFVEGITLTGMKG